MIEIILGDGSTVSFEGDVVDVYVGNLRTIGHPRIMTGEQIIEAIEAQARDVAQKVPSSLLRIKRASVSGGAVYRVISGVSVSSKTRTSEQKQTATRSKT